MSNEPLVSVILPCYNNEKIIRSRIDSVLNTKYPNYEIIIVDDGSSDRTRDLLIKYYQNNKKIKIITNNKNLGISPSKNIGIINSKGKYISIIETDQEVDPNWLIPVVRELESDPNIAGVQSKLLDINNRDLIEMCGLLFVPHTFWVIARGLSQSADKFNKKEYVGIGTGGCTLRKTVLEKIGYYDERCVYSQGDADSNWPIWIMGHKTLFVPESVVYHETFKPISRSKVQGFKRELNFHKTARVFLKNYEIINVVKYLPQLYVIYLVRAGSHLLRGNFYPIMGFLFSIIWNLIYLPDTLRRRVKIQKLRRVSDKKVMDYICTKGGFLDVYNRYLNPVIKEYENNDRGDKIMIALKEKKFNNVQI